jgi:hypothetical protein
MVEPNNFFISCTLRSKVTNPTTVNDKDTVNITAIITKEIFKRYTSQDQRDVNLNITKLNQNKGMPQIIGH